MKVRIIFFLLLFVIKLDGIGQSSNGTDTLSYPTKFLISQIHNQEAQTEYYKRQPSSMNIQFIAIVGSLGVAMVGILIALINKKNEKEKLMLIKKDEKEKLELIRINELIKDTRLMAAQMFEKTAEGFNSLNWILWVAKNTPNDFDIQLIKEHNQNMFKIYSELSGAQVKLSAYNKKLYVETKAVIHKLYHFDGIVGRLTPGVKNSDTKGDSVNQLGELWQEVFDFGECLPEVFSEILEKHCPYKT